MQVGDGFNKEADEKSAYNNVQVGEESQHREFRKEILQAMRVGVGPHHRSCDYDKVLLHS